MTGDELRIERLNRGFSRRGLARVIDVPEQSLRRLEQGLGVSPHYAKRIADFFGVKVSDLLLSLAVPERNGTDPRPPSDREAA